MTQALITEQIWHAICEQGAAQQSNTSYDFKAMSIDNLSVHCKRMWLCWHPAMDCSKIEECVMRTETQQS